MANITLKQLRYFLAVVRHGHFGRAAAASAISQPALSMQIKELEEGLGARLFERTARRISPTALGDAFARRARDILNAVDELGDLARAAQDDLTGRLRIGIIPTIAPYLLPKLIKCLSESHCDLDIHIRETLTPKLVQELVDGQIDTAIVALPVSEPMLEEVPIFSESFLLVRPEGDAHKPVPDNDALRAMRLLLLEEGHCFREQALSFCHSPPSLPHDGLDGSSLSTLVQMVGSGIGVTLIPEMAASIETRSAAVSICRFNNPQPSRTIGMIWRRTNPLAQQFGRLCDVVRQAADDMRQEHGGL